MWKLLRTSPRGWSCCKTLPATPERSQQELPLHIALGASLIATVKAMRPLRWHRPTPAPGSSVTTWTTPTSFSPCCADCGIIIIVRAEHQTAHALGEQLLTLAQQVQDPAMLVAAHRALGTTLFHLGAVASAHTHFAQGMALYDPQQHRASVFLYGEDAGVICHSHAALDAVVSGLS